MLSVASTRRRTKSGAIITAPGAISGLTRRSRLRETFALLTIAAFSIPGQDGRVKTLDTNERAAWRKDERQQAGAQEALAAGVGAPLRQSAIRRLTCLLLVFLASPALAERLPRAFDNAWCLYRTEHFDYLTDGPKRTALARIADLDRFRRLYMRYFPSRSEAPGLPLRILEYRRKRDFTEAAPDARIAGITLASLRGYQLVIGPVKRHALSDVAKHEYAHYLLRNHARRNYPLWYEEGLANFLSAASPARNGAMVLGQLGDGMADQGGLMRAISFPQLVDTRTLAGLTRKQSESLYANAWLAVHFLWFGQDKGFPDLDAALTRYLEDPNRDFTAAFGMSAQEFGEQVRAYSQMRPLPKLFLPLPHASPPSVETRCLDAEAARYQLAISLERLNPMLARRALEAPGGEQNPDWLSTLSRILTPGDRAEARELAQQALAIAPDHPAAIVQVARLRHWRCAFSGDPACIRRWNEAALLYEKALAQDPNLHDAAYGLGVAYLHTGRGELALHWLQKVYDKLPWVEEVNLFLGEALRQVDRQRSAEHLRKARDWAQSPEWRALAETALVRLEGSDA